MIIVMKPGIPAEEELRVKSYNHLSQIGRAHV